MTAAAEMLKARLGGLSPRYGIVLGSGLGSLVEALDETLRLSYAEIPGFPVSSVSGHAGELVAGTLSGVPVVMLSGRVHYYEQGDANAMRGPLETLKALGADILRLCVEVGGCLTGEHGVGLGKQKYMAAEHGAALAVKWLGMPMLPALAFAPFLAGIAEAAARDLCLLHQRLQA